MSLGPFAWAALLTGLKSRVRYHGLPDKTSFAASGRSRVETQFPSLGFWPVSYVCAGRRHALEIGRNAHRDRHPWAEREAKRTA
jgi:hypothetical protein